MLNVTELEESLRLLQGDRRIETVRAQLREVESTDGAVLDVVVTERSPFFAEVHANNQLARLSAVCALASPSSTRTCWGAAIPS